MAENDFEIKDATRQGVKPLIGLYAESGCGKTMSALLLARGFVGPSGKIVMCDTERGRGSLYADVIPGGYKTLELRPPFAPDRYSKALTAIEKSGAQIAVLDSGSHEWEGEGGVLDMAAENERQSGKSLNVWRQPKMEHAKFVLRLLQSPLPIIVCLRAKFKTRQTKENGKTVIVKDDLTTPIQADDFIFDMTVHGEIMQDHSFRLTKCSHPDLRKCFPDNKPIESKHGGMLAAWCSSAGGAPAPSGPDVKGMKRELWGLTQSVHLGDARKLNQHLWDEGIVSDTETLEGLTADRLVTVIEEVKARLAVGNVP